MLQYMPLCIYLKFEGMTERIIDGLEPGVFPLRPRVAQWLVNKKTEAKVRRRGFPLIPDYACTAHMVQGMTLRGALADCGDVLDNPALKDMLAGYVALSRVRTANTLLLLRAFSATLFRQGPPPGQRAALPPEGTPAPPVPPRRRGRGAARQPEATAAAASGDEAKPMRDRLATWHESREEQAIAQQAQQEVIARNLRPGKRQQRLAAQPALDEPRAWEVACEPTLYRLGMSPVQGCSPLTAEASEYPHYVDGGSHALPEEPSLLRRHGGDVGCGRVVRDGLLDRKEQLGLIASFERAMRSLFHQGAQTSFAPEAKSAVRQLGTEGHAYLMDVHRRVREQIAIDFRVPRLYSAGMLLTRIWADDLIPDDGMDVEPGHAYANPHVDKANRASYDYSALLYLNTQVH